MTVTAMEHVLVLSDDIEATREFYCDVVGLRVGERPPLEFPGYWLYAGDTPCLHIAERQAYLTHAAALGLAISPSRPARARSTTSRSAPPTTTRFAERLTTSGVRAVRNRVPAPGCASCSSRTPTACESRSTSETPMSRSEVADG